MRRELQLKLPVSNVSDYATVVAPYRSSMLEVTVSEPVKVNAGVNSYIKYKVSTQTDRPEYNGNESSVIRRFNDWVWLHNKLTAFFPGAIVPALPERSLVGRFEGSFVESRRQALQKFLTRVASHPELSASFQLVLFLQASDAALASTKDEDKRAALPQPRKVLELFQTSINHVQHSLSPASQSAQLPRTVTEDTIDNITTYVNVLDRHFAHVQKETGNLMRKDRALADASFQFGLAMTLLGQNEIGGLGEVLRNLGQTADQLSVLSGNDVESASLQFENPLIDYARMVTAVKDALHKRTQARIAYHHALMDVQYRNAVRDKLSQAGKVDKAQLAGGIATKAQQAADDAQEELDLISERFLRDFHSFMKEKSRDLKLIITEFVRSKMDYHKGIEAGLQELLPKLENLDVSNVEVPPPNHQGSPVDIGS